MPHQTDLDYPVSVSASSVAYSRAHSKEWPRDELCPEDRVHGARKSACGFCGVAAMIIAELSAGVKPSQVDRHAISDSFRGVCSTFVPMHNLPTKFIRFSDGF